MTRKQFKLYIDLENDDFADYPILAVARILQTLSKKLGLDIDEANYKMYQNLLDRNGNIVGRYAIKEVE